MYQPGGDTRRSPLKMLFFPSSFAFSPLLSLLHWTCLYTRIPLALACTPQTHRSLYVDCAAALVSSTAPVFASLHLHHFHNGHIVCAICFAALFACGAPCLSQGIRMLSAALASLHARTCRTVRGSLGTGAGMRSRRLCFELPVSRLYFFCSSALPGALPRLAGCSLCVSGHVAVNTPPPPACTLACSALLVCVECFSP